MTSKRLQATYRRMQPSSMEPLQILSTSAAARAPALSGFNRRRFPRAPTVTLDLGLINVNALGAYSAMSSEKYAIAD